MSFPLPQARRPAWASRCVERETACRVWCFGGIHDGAQRPGTCHLNGARRSGIRYPDGANVDPAHHPGRYAPSLTSSRTARSAEPGSRRVPRKCHWIPASAGMTAKECGALLPPECPPGTPSPLTSPGRHVPSLTSSRTARSAEPGSRRVPRKCMRRPFERPASQAVTAQSLDPGFRLRRPQDDIKNKTSSPPVRPSLDVISDGAQRRAGIQTGAPQMPLDPRLRGDDSKRMRRTFAP